MKEILLLAFLTFILSCKKKNGIDIYRPDSSLSKSFSRDVPRNKFSQEYNYTFVAINRRQVNLDNLELGYDSLAIRIWYRESFAPKIFVLELKLSKRSWSGVSHSLAVKESGEDMLADKIVITKHLQPRSNWKNLERNLINSNILTLPDMNSIEGLIDGIRDGSTYSFELATRNNYRFYSYHSPEGFKERFLQARYMMGILNLLQDEFGWPPGI